jgi:O-acetyl-ADP-ribose deacetylase (regulator of RNase III)
MGQDLKTNGELVYRAARAALELADELGATSIALPALGTGVGGLALEDCARSMREALEDAAPFTNLSEVRCVLFGPRAYEVFSSGFADAFA